MPKGKTSEAVKAIWAKRRHQKHGNITVTIRGPLSDKIRQVSLESGIHDANAWCREALEFMVFEHRSGRFRPDPYRHTARNNDDFALAHELEGGL